MAQKNIVIFIIRFYFSFFWEKRRNFVSLQHRLRTVMPDAAETGATYRPERCRISPRNTAPKDAKGKTFFRLTAYGLRGVIANYKYSLKTVAVVNSKRYT